MLVFSASLFAAEHGVMLRDGVIYISPDTSSAKLSNISRGREVAVIERTPGWVHVVGTVDVVTNIEVGSDEQSDRNVTGWIVDKGVITTTTPDGDKILFGEAFDSEMEASRRGGPSWSCAGRHASLRPHRRIFSGFPTGRRIALSQRRHPLATRGRRPGHPSLGKDCAILRCASPSTKST